ncbi:MAG: UDP-2,3-diacylglucosamine diphosphatase LpxI [Desulfobacterales bacterium]|nr:UDP-2,3-diacylglucosamine diphosphatase LpxI [Desulfobacterales bacterium]
MGKPDNKKIGIIAGSGQFPIIFSERAKENGFSVYVVAYVNHADPEVEENAEAVEWLHIGQVKKLIKFFKKNGVNEAVMIGAIKKTKVISEIKPDLKAIAMVAGMKNTHDDGIMSAFARGLEKEGITIRPSTFLLPDLLAAPGCWTKRKPSKTEKADIELGWKIAKEVGRLDIGQCVVVSEGSVLAVEAIDGTDATIARGGKLGRGNAVVVKVCKPNQDTRFDIPAIGKSTIETMYNSGATVLTVEAGKAVVFNKSEMISCADKYGISIIAQLDE